jgi:hypothetical protein
MSLLHFLTQLWQSGRVEVSSQQDAIAVDGPAITDFLQSQEQALRDDLPFIPPPLNVDTARWAALKLYRGAQFLAFSEAKPALIQKVLHDPLISDDSPTNNAYSVDLSFRFLPDLLRLSMQSQERNALLASLRKLATDWPLSSIGVTDLGPLRNFDFLQSPCLKQLYIDRIIAAKDLARLTTKDIRNAVRASLGAYPELCPELSEPLLILDVEEGHEPELERAGKSP